jgi:hypothetical protein
MFVTCQPTNSEADHLQCSIPHQISPRPKRLRDNARCKIGPLERKNCCAPFSRVSMTCGGAVPPIPEYEASSPLYSTLYSSLPFPFVRWALKITRTPNLAWNVPFQGQCRFLLLSRIAANSARQTTDRSAVTSQLK